MYLLNDAILVFLVCPLLSRGSCDGKADLCVLGLDGTSLIQTRNSIELGSDRANWYDTNRSKTVDSVTDLDQQVLAPRNQTPIVSVNMNRTHHEAQQIISESTITALTSFGRQMATVNLALMSLTVPGDFVETGVYQGGTSILMAKVLQKHDLKRKLWSADSFQGLPDESTHEIVKAAASGFDGSWQSALTNIIGNANYMGAGRVSNNIGHTGDYASSRQVFENNLHLNEINTEKSNMRVNVLEGYFNESLSKAPIQNISFLRLDGDMYVSTMDALKNLYGKVVHGGFIYVDDYGSYIGCKHAIDEFRTNNDIHDTMYAIYEGNRFDAVWWRKGYKKPCGKPCLKFYS